MVADKLEFVPVGMAFRVDNLGGFGTNFRERANSTNFVRCWPTLARIRLIPREFGEFRAP